MPLKTSQSPSSVVSWVQMRSKWAGFQSSAKCRQISSRMSRAVPAEARLRMEPGLVTCGGPFTAEAVTHLAEARARLLARPQVAARIQDR